MYRHSSEGSVVEIEIVGFRDRTENPTIYHLDIYQLMRAAGQIETLLGLGARNPFVDPRKALR